jgi:hypothetical protein
VRSVEFGFVVAAELERRTAEVKAAFADREVIGKDFDWAIDVTGIEFRKEGAEDLYYAIKRARLSEIRIKTSVLRNPFDPNRLEVNHVDVSGVLTDTFDFNLDDAEFPEAGAIVQAGTWGVAGHVFKLEVNFQNTRRVFTGEWTLP